MAHVANIATRPSPQRRAYAVIMVSLVILLEELSKSVGTGKHVSAAAGSSVRVHARPQSNPSIEGALPLSKIREAKLEAKSVAGRHCFGAA